MLKIDWINRHLVVLQCSPRQNILNTSAEINRPCFRHSVKMISEPNRQIMASKGSEGPQFVRSV
jgi:hypothetical protein